MISPKMLYVADLGHDCLLKVGITDRRESIRVGELRRQLGEPKLEVFLTEFVPAGWGTDRSWELRLLRNIRRRSRRLQLFAKQHECTEVVEATRSEAHSELTLMLRETEANPRLSALQLDSQREDWRFRYFMSRPSGDPYYSFGDWSNPILRQVFLYSLRHEPTTRWEREALGYSCEEIEQIFVAQRKACSEANISASATITGQQI